MVKDTQSAVLQVFVALVSGILIGVATWALTEADFIPVRQAWEIAFIVFALASVAIIAWGIFGGWAMDDVATRRSLANARRGMSGLSRVITASHLPEIPRSMLDVLAFHAASLSPGEFHRFLAISEYESRRRYFRTFEELSTREPSVQFWRSEQHRMLRALLDHVAQNFSVAQVYGSKNTARPKILERFRRKA